MHVLYCDDIRHEITGKTTLVGVYGSVMFVREFPAMLPQLCVAVWVMLPFGAPPKSLRIKVLFDDNQLAEMDIGTEDPEQVKLPAGEDFAWISAQPQLVFSPLEIPGPGKISVQAVADGKELSSASLRIMKAPPGEGQQTGGA